jgi:hypothetical protein
VSETIPWRERRGTINARQSVSGTGCATMAAIVALITGFLVFCSHQKPDTTFIAAPTSPPGRSEAPGHDMIAASAPETATQVVEVRRALPVTKSDNVADLPRPDLTPGDVFESVTVADLRVSGYSRRMRNVPESERRSVFAAYGIPWEERHNYELDHLVSLEIGGSNSPRRCSVRSWS